MTKMQVSARINKTTGKPELFFYNSYYLEYYDGQHGNCTITYMRYCTRPPKTIEEQSACNWLFAQWVALPGGDPSYLVRRLKVRGAK
jgi:hypothetical protein